MATATKTPVARSRAQLWLLYGNVACYAACYMSQVPVLPYLTKSLGADMEAYGRAMTANAIVQVVGGLISGPLIDVYGAKLLLLLSYGASAACYGLTGAAQSMTLVYVSRLPTVLQHAVMATRAAVAESSSEAERAAALGYIGVAYGVGMTVGPALGGALSKRDVRLGAWAATAGSLLSLLSIAVGYRDAPPSGAAADAAPAGAPARRAAAKRVGFGEVARVAALPAVPSLLAVKTLSGLADALFHSAFPLVTASQFGLDAAGAGLLFSYTGVLSMLTQATLVPWATARYDERRIVRLCVWVLALCFAALATARTTASLCALLLPLTAAGALMGTTVTALLTKAAPAGDTGTVVAVDMAVGSAVQVVSPSVATAALARSGFGAVGGLGSGCLLALALLMQARVVVAAGAPGGGGGAGVTTRSRSRKQSM